MQDRFTLSELSQQETGSFRSVSISGLKLNLTINPCLTVETACVLVWGESVFCGANFFVCPLVSHVGLFHRVAEQGVRGAQSIKRKPRAPQREEKMQRLAQQGSRRRA